MDLRDNLSILLRQYASLAHASGWADMWARPFGLLAPVHEAALRGRNLDLTDPVAVATYFVLPSLALVLQAYLLVQPGAPGTPRPAPASSRLVRIGASLVTLSLMANAYFSYRFTRESRVRGAGKRHMRRGRNSAAACPRRCAQTAGRSPSPGCPA